MQTPPVMLVVILTILFVAVCAFTLGPRTVSGFSRIAGTIAVLPPVAMLCLFYSLALHMHRSLGAWPSSLGEDGFPPQLATHVDITQCAFSIFLLSSVSVFPQALLCASVPRWRDSLRYVGIHGISCCACFGAMMLAPSSFLIWWWD